MAIFETFFYIGSALGLSILLTLIVPAYFILKKKK